MKRLPELKRAEALALNRLLTHGLHIKGGTLGAGSLVRGLRVRLMMTQRQLAKRSGVPQTHISRIERGEKDPQVGTLARLLDALFCDLVLVPRQRLLLAHARYAQIEKAAYCPGHLQWDFHEVRSRVWNE